MKLAKRILLVEDDEHLGFVIQDNLQMNGFDVHLCRDGSEGLMYFNKNTYDLCIIDVMLPKKDGFSLALDIKKANKELPLIFLTAKSLPEDKIRGLQIGADDYITKPFNNEEFLLRIKAVLKRSDNSGLTMELTDHFEIGNYRYDALSYVLKHNGEEKKLTKKEGAILRLLCQHKNKLIERELVLNMIWGADNYFVGRSLDVFITKLRKYLQDDPRVRIINAHGIGFKLTDIE